jgi:hypothetical protein
MEEVDHLHSTLVSEGECGNKRKPRKEKITFASILIDSIDEEEATKEVEQTIAEDKKQELNIEGKEKDEKEEDKPAEEDKEEKEQTTDSAEEELGAALGKVAINEQIGNDSDDEMSIETGLNIDTEDLRKGDEEEERNPTEKGYM